MGPVAQGNKGEEALRYMDKFTYDLKMQLDKNHTLYSDMLDLMTDCIAAGYSTFGLVNRQYLNNSDSSSKEWDRVSGLVLIDSEEEVQHTVTYETVHKGLTLMLADDGTLQENGSVLMFAPSTGDTPRVCATLLIIGTDDCGTIDAGDADAIIQLGLFGEVRYG